MPTLMTLSLLSVMTARLLTLSFCSSAASGEAEEPDHGDAWHFSGTTGCGIGMQLATYVSDKPEHTLLEYDLASCFRKCDSITCHLHFAVLTD